MSDEARSIYAMTKASPRARLYSGFLDKLYRARFNSARLSVKNKKLRVYRKAPSSSSYHMSPRHRRVLYLGCWARSYANLCVYVSFFPIDCSRNLYSKSSSWKNYIQYNNVRGTARPSSGLDNRVTWRKTAEKFSRTKVSFDRFAFSVMGEGECGTRDGVRWRS